MVKIQEGCNQVCAYCIVPKVRGRERSRTPQEILEEIAKYITLGYQDLAQDLGVLGSDDQDRIIDEKRHQILKASKKYGKTCSMLVNSIEQAEKWKKEGVLLLNFSSDVSVLMEGYKSAIEKITK